MRAWHRGKPLTAEEWVTQFWAKVNIGKDHECWPWKASLTPAGYAQVNWQGRPAPGHRIAWRLRRGPIPPGMCVLHHCDNPPCVNPAHLFLGTKADNVRDMDDKGRRKSGPRRGEKSHLAKLTAEDVRAIRSAVADGAVQMRLAENYGVTVSAINCIVHRKCWRHIE